MDMCLLCLELQHESVDCIYVCSRQWEEDNIEQLIEQHFWPMDSITSDSWICLACWHILNEFHQFYIRVEDAHVDMASMDKIVVESPRQLLEVAESNVADFEDIMDKELSQQIEGINMITNSNGMSAAEEQLTLDQLGESNLHGDCNNFEQALSMEQAITNYFHENVIHQEQVLQMDQVQIIGFDASSINTENAFSVDIMQTSHSNRVDAYNDTEQQLPSDLIPQASQFVEKVVVEYEGCLDQLKISGTHTDHINLEQDLDNIDHRQTIQIDLDEQNKGIQSELPIDPPVGLDNYTTQGKCNVEQPTPSCEKKRVRRQDPLKNPFLAMDNNIAKITSDADDVIAEILNSIEGKDNDKQDLPIEDRPISQLVQIEVEQSVGANNEPESQSRRIHNELATEKMQTSPKAAEANDRTQSKCKENEPMIDYEKTRLRRRDPLKKSLFTKVKRIPKRKLKTENVTAEVLDSIDDISNNKFEDNLNKTNNDVPDESVNIEMETERSNDKTHAKPPESNENEDNSQESEEVPIDYLSDYNSSYTNSDHQTDSEQSALDKYKSRLTHHDYDDFLSKNFKMFCSICHVAMRTFQELRKHFDKAHKRRGYVNCCDRRFLKRRNLVEHIQWHCEPDNYKCKYCSKVLSTKRCLNLHEKRVHEKDYIKFKCDICEKSFTTVHVLKKHKLTHLSEDEKRFRCDQCEKKFGSNSLLYDHIRSVHMAKYVKICEHCGQKLRCRNDIERHKLKHQGVPLPFFTCDICGLKMTQMKALNRHKLLKHPAGGKREYKCHICSKVSDNLSALQGHIQYNHEMTRDYKCTICSKSFKKLFTLKEHMAGHNKTPLFSCPYCPNKFYSNANMHSHRKKDHPQEWLEDRYKKYSGKLPPNLKPPSTLMLNK